MSRWDEYDRMQERMEQGLADMRDRVHIEPLPEHTAAIEKFKDEIQAKILSGVTEGKTWRLQADGNVKIDNQAYPFKVQLPRATGSITEARVDKFLKAHKLPLDAEGVFKITEIVRDMPDSEAKAYLKQLILRHKASRQNTHWHSTLT